MTVDNANLGAASIYLSGDTEIARRYIPQARKRLIMEQLYMLDDRIDLSRRAFTLAAGVTMQIYALGGINTISIHAVPVTITTDEIPSGLPYVALGLTNEWYYSDTGDNDDWVDGTAGANIQLVAANRFVERSGQLYLFDSNGDEYGKYQVSANGRTFGEVQDFSSVFPALNPPTLDGFNFVGGHARDNGTMIVAYQEIDLDVSPTPDTHFFQTTDGENWTKLAFKLDYTASETFSHITYLNGSWIVCCSSPNDTNGAILFRTSNDDLTGTSESWLYQPSGGCENATNLYNILYLPASDDYPTIPANGTTVAGIRWGVADPDVSRVMRCTWPFFGGDEFSFNCGSWSERYSIESNTALQFTQSGYDAVNHKVLIGGNTGSENRILETFDGTTFTERHLDQTWIDLGHFSIHQIGRHHDDEWWIATGGQPVRAKNGEDDWQLGPANVNATQILGFPSA